MPERKTIERARRDKREGEAPTTQAVAIGLSKARRAGVDLPPPEKGEASEETRRSARRALEAGQEKPNAKAPPKRSRATTTALQREGRAAASETALSRQAKAAARERTASERSAAAQKAARTRARHKAGG